MANTSKVTSLEQHKINLAEIVKKYNVKNVLDCGVEQGISTKIFIENCDVTSIDIIEPEWNWYEIDRKKLKFYKEDVSQFIRKEQGQFDMVFCDITYYTNNDEYGTKKAYNYEFKKLMEDLPFYHKLVKEGGVLVINDYINLCGQRWSVKDAFNRFACEINKPFVVYPTRGGMAVLQK